MDSDLFCEWLEDVFVPHCGRNRPVLLIMDNLGAHITSKAIDIARENNIELLCLQPHSTHLLQPLDVRVFHLVKSNLAKAADRLGYQVTKISRGHMPNLINYSLNMLSLHDVQESFRLTGIYPFNPAIMNSLKQTLSKEPKQSDKNEQSNDKSNCLVEMGIIPASLVSILVPPPEKKVEKRLVVLV